MLKSINKDFDSHYPLFLTANERTRDDYDYNEVLLSFTITKDNSNILRHPPRRKRKLAEASHAHDESHDNEGDHDAHDLVVHVTYESIYAILVFLVTATAFGIITSMIGMVSAILYLMIEIFSCMSYLVHSICADPLFSLL